jgi:alginate O-acetyltransferase complex protein AlgI
MSFVQLEFLGFFVVVALLNLVAPSRRIQNAVLLVASGVFYGWVHPWYLGLLAFSTLLDFGAGLGMARWPNRKGALLALSIAGNVFLLGAFKYLDFFIDSWVVALSALGVHTPMHALGIALPVGISFFTFQTMSYTIDVYRGELKPRRSLLDYATFVCLFPQLVAGPIERAAKLLPQIERRRTVTAKRFADGLGLALWGAAQKVVVADNLGLYVDRVWSMDDASGPMVWGAALAFTVEILADFGGYTDMARGVARMLGIELSENFRAPYLASGPLEFWQRWHISLSTWLRDYVYLPLVFSDTARRWLPVPGKGKWHTWGRLCLAMVTTMLLSGLWHGARWTCVLWGLYWGLLMCIWLTAQRIVPARVRRRPGWRFILVPLTFVLTVIGMLIFREPDLAGLVQHLSLAPLGGDWRRWVAASVIVDLAVAGGLLLAFGGWLRRRTVDGPAWLRALPLRTSLWAAGAVALFLFSRETARAFIYFQF